MRKIFPKVRLLLDEESLLSYLKSCEGELLVYDNETFGLYHGAPLLGTSFCSFKDRVPYFVPNRDVFSKGVPMEGIKRVFNEMFPKLRGMAHNAKYDLGVFKYLGIVDIPTEHDTALLIHSYNPDALKKLETRVKEDLKIEKKTFEEIIGKKWNKIKWVTEADDLLDLLAQYAGEDTYATGLLFDLYYPKLDEGMLKVYKEIEMPLVSVLRDMKHRGVLIDVPFLNKLSVEMEKGIEECKELIYKEAGGYFNLNSPKQKADVLYDIMGLPCMKTTKAGGRSTDSEVLEELSFMGIPIATQLLEYSVLNKLHSGYALAIPELCDAHNILRGDINSDGTRTGRFSSSNPNLQNQPNNSKYPIRQAFIPRRGYKFINYDFSQIELRIMAHVSMDAALLHTFRSGGDIHAKVANDLHISRKGAKVVNFGILYGMGKEKLANTIGVEVMEAERIIVGYERAYPGYTKWKRDTENFAIKNGFIVNVFGRVRWLKDAQNSTNKKAFYGALRKACNTVVQGSAADLIKLCMIKVHQEYIKRGMDAHILLTVHDELLVEAHESCMIEAEKILKDIMENTVKFEVPILSEGKILEHWAEMKDDDILSVPYRPTDLSLLMCLIN